MWSNYSLLPFRQVSQHSPERQCAAKKKKVSFFFFFRPVKTLSLDFLIHLICINIAGWHQQFNHLINLDLSIYADQHKLRHLENGLQAVGSMRWTGSKCMFRTAAAHVESEACSYSTLHESKAKDCFIFSALIRILLSYIFNSVWWNILFITIQAIVQSFFKHLELSESVNPLSYSLLWPRHVHAPDLTNVYPPSLKDNPLIPSSFLIEKGKPGSTGESRRSPAVRNPLKTMWTAAGGQSKDHYWASLMYCSCLIATRTVRWSLLHVYQRCELIIEENLLLTLEYRFMLFQS